MTTQLRQEIVATVVETVLNGNGFRVCLLPHERRSGITQAVVTTLLNTKTKLNGLIVCSPTDLESYGKTGIPVTTFNAWNASEQNLSYDFCIIDGWESAIRLPDARMQLLIIHRKIWHADTAEGERLRRRCANFTQIEVE